MSLNKYVDRIASTVKGNNEKVGDHIDLFRQVIGAVLDDAQLKKNFDGAAIRYAAMCGEITNRVMAVLGGSEFVDLLAIGDVNMPAFAVEVADQIVNDSYRYHDQLSKDFGRGYDLTSQGAEAARSSFFDYADKYYGFSAVHGLKEKMVENSTIVGGGMRGLDDIATAMIRNADKLGLKNRFISPDNSFGTWHSIVNLRTHGGHSVHTLKTGQDNFLHLSATNIDKFYDGVETPMETVQDVWCITPVGNPSGTFMSGDQLASTCEAIVNRNPNAIILLDSTYVRLLSPGRSKALVEGVLSNPSVIDRVVFLDSFSKTHGFCGERIGLYFAANKEVFDPIQTVNMTLSAGNGRYKDALVMAICNSSEERELILQEVHDFWMKERKGLFDKLITSGSFGHLFDEQQLHVVDEQMDEPGLYLFLKLKEGVTGLDVLKETHCLGVETKMGDGNYIRFAVGKISEPRFSQK
ncbi:hypothetical protein COU74_00675 [Candidatus Peregrinibacteria bacterium CG10_big_fil_rev_8_21_14_0_10_36_19]|nr:MAG: hypothetical protein COU74_00675 [Candidatus Peregrinibacteria bacterium CG10_big_fil_rev_8_21_14_0_10_36_19]